MERATPWPMQMPFDSLTELSDDALLALFANGDAGAARALTLRFTPRALAHAQRVLGDAAEAEDVAQEAMMRLWRMAPDWRAGEAQLGTWLYRVVANLCTDRLRKRRTVDIDSLPERADKSPSADARLQQQQRAAALQQALMHLPDRQRQAVVLRHIEGLANPQIATILGVGVEAVESLTARGTRALGRLLLGRRAELGFDDDQNEQ